MTDKIAPLEKELIKLKNQGKKQSEIARVIREKTGLGETQSKVYAKQIINHDVLSISEKSVKSDIKELEYTKKYVYNSESKKYIFLCRNLGKNIVLEESLVKRLLTCYSNFNGESDSVSKISLQFNLPKVVVKEILSCLQFTHDDLPITDPELVENNEETLVEELIQTKKFHVHQKFQKKDWEETLEKARNWDDFKHGTIHPLEDLLNTWKAPEYKPVKLLNKSNSSSDRYMLLGLNDLHFGLFTQGRQLFNGKNWDISKTEEIIKSYGEQVRKEVEDRKGGFKGAIICIGGDIIHGLKGLTDKGTHVESHPLGEEQLDRAFSSLVLFFNEMLTIFPEITVKTVAGNHDSVGDYTISKLLETYYRSEKRINFEISTAPWLCFRVLDSLFVLGHGASAPFKHKIPPKGKARESYFMSIFLSKPELLQGIKSRYIISHDQHHSETQECKSFEFIMFSSPSQDDRYADNLNLRSRPRQNGLVITKEGVTNLIHFYFD